MSDKRKEISDRAQKLLEEGTGVLQIIGEIDKKSKSGSSSISELNIKYQSWYAKASDFIRQIAPDRYEEFLQMYIPQKNRKTIDVLSYTISDYLHGISVSRGGVPMFSTSSVLSTKATTQVLILKSVKERIEDHLNNISAVLEADIFRREIDVAADLVKKGHLRSAGAICGVLLERHLKTVCQNHAVVLSKKTPTISDMNDPLKNSGVIDVSQWRHIQFLGDIRNICVHDKEKDPTKEQINDLIDGVRKISSTVF